jgi:hypothetical protein
MYAAMATGRNSVGFEIDKNFKDVITSQLDGIVNYSNKRINNRLEDHLKFVGSRFEKMGKFKYVNKHYRFPVMTNQETQLLINQLHSIENIGENEFEAFYSDEPQDAFVGNWEDYVLTKNELADIKSKSRPNKSSDKQRKLFA